MHDCKIPPSPPPHLAQAPLLGHVKSPCPPPQQSERNQRKWVRTKTRMWHLVLRRGKFSSQPPNSFCYNAVKNAKTWKKFNRACHESDSTINTEEDGSDVYAEKPAETRNKKRDDTSACEKQIPGKWLARGATGWFRKTLAPAARKYLQKKAT